MASNFKDISLKPSEKVTIKLPKKFGASDARGSVVELQANNVLGQKSFFLELYDKKRSAEYITKATAKNYLQYVDRGLYNGSIFHRSVPGFVLQGGGFSAPLVSSSEGGVPEEISDFGSVNNQPGNSNIRGTVAMAKLGGLPDSATNQWFVNLNNNISLDTQNQGFTVFGKVLGNGMDVVDDLASAEPLNFGGVFSQLPLWNLPDENVGIQPEDYLTIDLARKLSAKDQPFTLFVNSSDDDLLSASVTKKQQIKLKASKDASGKATVSVRSVSLVDGSANEQSFDVLIGGNSSGGGESKNDKIDILVDGGSFDEPFYKFFDSSGNELDNFKINVKKTYRFARLDNASTHPFYLGDSGFNQSSSKYIKIKGDGNFENGITGSEAITFNVKKKYRSEFKQNGRLDYFCTSHSSMYGSFLIKGAESVDSLDPQLQEAIVPVD